ncbi:hypothetical protein NE237_033098 [Protea cynaroides]|uniref:Uncharacterized protein n=1 Tax=Protea cynaroides TaxID=273540 RepID=A0A9Q0L5D0_9MAGN|nr:hypothetical protein NE237_033098 [Protea cynaroides]
MKPPSSTLNTLKASVSASSSSILSSSSAKSLVLKRCRDRDEAGSYLEKYHETMGSSRYRNHIVIVSATEPGKSSYDSQPFYSIGFNQTGNPTLRPCQARHSFCAAFRFRRSWSVRFLGIPDFKFCLHYDCIISCRFHEVILDHVKVFGCGC